MKINTNTNTTNENHIRKKAIKYISGESNVFV